MSGNGSGWQCNDAATLLIETARTNCDAFGDLYDQYVDQVYRFCLAQVDTVQQAEDLTEETFNRALAAITRPTEQAGRDAGASPTVSTWLLCLAATATRDAQRHDLTPHHAPEWEQTDPHALVAEWERAARLQAGCALLPATYQRVVRLRYWEGYDWAGVARKMGQSEAAVKRLGKRALRRFTVLLRAKSGSFPVAGAAPSPPQ